MSVIRSVAKVLAHKPALTLAVVLVLALGIGASSAFYSVFHSIVLRPLPFPDAGRIVRVEGRDIASGEIFSKVSFPQYQAWRSASSLQNVAAYHRTVRILMSPDGAELLRGYTVSHEFFHTLGLDPVEGRLFSPDDFRPESSPVALVGQAWWQSRFGGDPGVIGEDIVLNGNTHTVIGVVPTDLTKEVFPEGDLWLPLKIAASDSRASDNGTRWLQVVANLRGAVEPSGAEVELTGLMRRLERESGGGRVQAAVSKLGASLVRDVEPVLARLFLLMGAVLAVACINTSALMLIKTKAREHEFAVRKALGASRRQVAGQVLLENLLLALLGGLAGLAGAAACLPMIASLAQHHLPRSIEVQLNLQVLAFGIGISLLSGLLVGSLPAVRMASKNFEDDLYGRLKPSFRPRLTRRLLVVAEIAISVALLLSAGLLLKSLWLLTTTDMGYETNRVLSFAVNPMGAQYQEAAQVRAYYSRLIRELKSVPGVRTVGAVSAAPLTTDSDLSQGIGLAGQPPEDRSERMVFRKFIHGDYLQALDISVLAGRAFGERDMDPRRRSALVTQSVAETLERPELVGREVETSFGTFQVVGIVENIRHAGPQQPPPLVVYLPFPAYPRQYMHLVIRTETAPETVLDPVRRKVVEIEPMAPIFGMSTLEERFDQRVASPRLIGVLVSLFAVLTLFFALGGLYATVSQSAAERTLEWGIRGAVGASRLDILGLILKEALGLLAVGLVIGMGTAYSSSSLLSNQLHGVAPNDAWIYAGIVGAISVAVLLASLAPAIKATRVSPAEVLRAEL